MWGAGGVSHRQETQVHPSQAVHTPDVYQALMHKVSHQLVKGIRLLQVQPVVCLLEEHGVCVGDELANRFAAKPAPRRTLGGRV